MAGVGGHILYSALELEMYPMQKQGTDQEAIGSQSLGLNGFSLGKPSVHLNQVARNNSTILNLHIWKRKYNPLSPDSPAPQPPGPSSITPGGGGATNKLGLPRPLGGSFHLLMFPPVKWGNDTPPSHPEGVTSRPPFSCQREEASRSISIIYHNYQQPQVFMWSNLWQLLELLSRKRHDCLLPDFS